jgi:hypothetical protein
MADTNDICQFGGKSSSRQDYWRSPRLNFDVANAPNKEG